MKKTRIIMGMPITINILDDKDSSGAIEQAYSYFSYVDRNFSTYKRRSEISRFNRGEIIKADLSSDMHEVFRLCEETRKFTNGFFQIKRGNIYDPSGLVKGWSVYNTARLIENLGFKNFFIDAGGDVEVRGKNELGGKWRIGIKNPFDKRKLVKIVSLEKGGIATSGGYERGDHIYNPKKINNLNEIASITVIGPNVFEADRFSTAAYAMGKKGIYLIEKLVGLEGIMIDKRGIATTTSGFDNYVYYDDELKEIVKLRRYSTVKN